MTCTDTQKLIKIIRDKSNDLLDSELRLLLVEDVVSLVDDELESVHLLVQTPALVQLGPGVVCEIWGGKYCCGEEDYLAILREEFSSSFSASSEAIF